MKTLSMYIDRWYIVAAVDSDNVLRHIELPNREDRIWLFFYENTNNDKIIYGKNNQQHFLNKELHYYGDIFEKIVKEDEKFERYGRNVNIREIFRASDIIEHLKQDFSETEEIITYVSFSADVIPAAQKVFLDILKDNNFKVEESVVRISHLAVEFSSRQGRLNNANNILTITACNENLRYVIYSKAQNVFVRQGNEGVLQGYGTDLRGRALLEQIVSQINSTSRFLTTKEEEEFEIKRLSQNLERWLLQLDNTRQVRPIIYNNITFSRTPHNQHSVCIQKNEIENRTKVIVNDVVDNIIQYVKENQISPTDISHILFIGNTFNNRMFKDALLRQYPINNDNIIIYQDSFLPEIVGIYRHLDLSQFDSLRREREVLSNEQLEQIRLAEEERKRREDAIREQEEIDQEHAAAREAENKFNTALHEAENYEKKGDYSNMIDFLNIALTHKPDDKEVKQLLEDANRKLSEIKVKNEQYNKTIKVAQEAFNEQRWQEALSKSETALDLSPDSQEAKRIKAESLKKIKLEKSLNEFLLRADVFIGQKLYTEAINELNKAKLIDENNETILSKIKKIENEQNKIKTKIKNLEQKFSEAKTKGEFDEAIKICENLSILELENQHKWKKYIDELKEEKNNVKHLEDLKQQINSASFNENWDKVAAICKEALKIKQDEIISKFLEKANDKIKLNNFNKNISHIESLLDKGDIKLASSLAKDLKNTYPEKDKEIKVLFKKIFNMQNDFNNKTHNPIQKDKNDEDFFGNNTTSTKTKTQKSNTNKKSNDDFFDINIKNDNKKKKIVENKDFDF
jgi:hypothetical protein